MDVLTELMKALGQLSPIAVSFLILYILLRWLKTETEARYAREEASDERQDTHETESRTERLKEIEIQATDRNAQIRIQALLTDALIGIHAETKAEQKKLQDKQNELQEAANRRDGVQKSLVEKVDAILAALDADKKTLENVTSSNLALQISVDALTTRFEVFRKDVERFFGNTLDRAEVDAKLEGLRTEMLDKLKRQTAELQVSLPAPQPEANPL